MCTQTRFSACLLMSSLAWAALSWQSSGQPPSDAPSAARAVHKYALANCEIEIGPPSEVGRAQGHFWFSTLHRVEGQDILCEVVLADDKAQGQWPAALHLSRDGGALATIVTPNTILRWHRELVAQKWDFSALRKRLVGLAPSRK